MPIASLSVPHYKQELPSSCVAACVRMVLAHYGRPCTEEELRQLLGSGAHGTRARNLFLIEPLGFDVQVETFSLAQLGAALVAGIPPLVFLETSFLDYWNTRCDHVAVVVGLDLATASLNDPYFDTAPQQTSLAGFQSAWAANEHLAAMIRPEP
jgi:ABC-type bacteriocin/lantibiotic exporter with double-glycine peptidase domain